LSYIWNWPGKDSVIIYGTGSSGEKKEIGAQKKVIFLFSSLKISRRT
jgi:hypothetical protein